MSFGNSQQNNSMNQVSVSRSSYTALFIGVALFTVLAFVIIFLTENRRANTAAAVDIAGRNRMLSQRIAYLALQSNFGDANVHSELNQLIDLHDTSINALEFGGATTNSAGEVILDQPNVDVAAVVAKAQGLWRAYKANALILATDESTDEEKAKAYTFIHANAKNILELNAAVVRSLVREDEQSQEQFYLVMLALLALDLAFLAILYMRIQESRKQLQADLAERSASVKKIQQKEQDVLNKTEDLEEQQVAMLNILEDLESERTKLIESQQRTKEANARFLSATQAANIAVLEMDVAEQRIYWDKTAASLYGLPAEIESIGMEEWMGFIHPEDVALVQDSIQKTLESKIPFDCIYRIVLASGTVRYIKGYGVLQLDTNGKPVKMIGVNVDVTREQEIDKAKSEFVSLASHQLRTPLSSINWYTEVLLDGTLGELNDEQRNNIHDIALVSQHMVELVNALLNVSRIDLGTFMIDSKPIDISQTLSEVLQEIEGMRTKKQVTIQQQIAESVPNPYLADEKLLRIILQNLISNAVKYSENRTSIEVEITASSGDERDQHLEEDALLIAVTDHGMGIPEEQQPEIFTKLFRASNAKESSVDGTGLGLYIVKSIAEQSGGSVWFASVENEGTTFYVALPLNGMHKKSGTKSLS